MERTLPPSICAISLVETIGDAKQPTTKVYPSGIDPPDKKLSDKKWFATDVLNLSLHSTYNFGGPTVRLLTLVLLAVTFPLNAVAQEVPNVPKVIVSNIRRVFHNGEHNAFTDLTKFKNRYYLTFRTCPMATWFIRPPVFLF